MRTKTILLSAACGLLAAAAANADSVYSVNVVGYVNKTFTGGKYAMFTNPLNNTNTLGSLFPQLTDADSGCNIYSWNSTTHSYDYYTYLDAADGWYNGDTSVDANAVTLAPGRGAWFFAENTTTSTFVGDVLTGSLSINIPVGWSQIGSQVPLSTDLVAQGLGGGDGDYVYTWTGTAWGSWTYVEGAGWYNADTSNPENPVLGLGEGAWYWNNNAAYTWNRTFTISQ